MQLVIGECVIDLSAVADLSTAAIAFVQASLNPVPDLVIQSNTAARSLIGQRCFIAEPVWELRQSATQNQVVWHDVAAATIMATLTSNLGWPRHAVLSHADHVGATALLFDYPLLQLALMDYFAVHNGGLLHACAVLDGDHTVLLVGPPEVGKSTSARLWHTAGATILSDDRVVVRQRAERLWAYGTPWHSSTPLVSPAAAPIKALLFLQHGATNHATPLTSAAAMRRLLPELYLPLWDAVAVEQVLGLADQIVVQIPCYQFAFVPNASAVDYVRQLLR